MIYDQSDAYKYGNNLLSIDNALLSILNKLFPYLYASDWSYIINIHKWLFTNAVIMGLRSHEDIVCSTQFGYKDHFILSDRGNTYKLNKLRLENKSIYNDIKQYIINKI